MDAKLKHLEFIQAVISRMSTSSFLFKGWAITLAAALAAFGSVDTRWALLAIGAIATLLFWGLDAYYLWLERCFIKLYEKVAAASNNDIDFAMRPEKPGNREAALQWFMTCWRAHLAFFYGIIIAINVIGVFIVRSK